jgi:hypothetical protein
VRRFQRDPRQYRWVRAEIIAIAYWMNFFLEECEQVVAQTAEQRPDLISLSARVVCNQCREKLHSARRHNQRQAEDKGLTPETVWEAQVESLLASTNRVAIDLFEQACCSSDPKKFPECLTKLRNAVLRQQRYLAQIGAKETKLSAESQSVTCAECGESISIEQAPETRIGKLSSPR